MVVLGGRGARADSRACARARRFLTRGGAGDVYGALYCTVQKLLSLPRTPSVNKILDQFMHSKIRSLRSRQSRRRNHGPGAVSAASSHAASPETSLSAAQKPDQAPKSAAGDANASTAGAPPPQAAVAADRDAHASASASPASSGEVTDIAVWAAAAMASDKKEEKEFLGPW